MIWGGLRISRHAIAGLIAVAALVVPAQAGAATVGVIGDTLAIAGGAESSSLTVTRSGTSIVVADAALNVSASDHCYQSSDRRRAVCSAAAVNRIVAVLLDGNDALDWSGVSLPTSFYGGNGDDSAVGGSGVDSFDTGAGNDSIAARDGRAESLRCGAGADRGSADANDTLTGDCESEVERPGVIAPTPAEPALDPPADDPAATGDGGTGATDPVPGDDDPAPEHAQTPVTIEAPPLLQATATGKIQIGVSCTAKSGDCTGSVEVLEEGGVVKTRAKVTSARRGARAGVTKRGRKKVVLGRARFSVAAGETEAVTVRLSRAGRQRIIKKKKRRTRAKLAVTVVAADGTKSTSVKTVTIALPKERRTSGRSKPKPPPKGRHAR
jgi:hypothetical protein